MIKKKIATIQVDLDGLWTNLQYYGHDSQISPDVVIESSIKRYLDLFDEFNVKATFFVIGKDIEVPEKKVLFKEIFERGHELANHTYSHIFGFRKLSSEEKITEIKQTEELIYSITGKKPVGFKAPGYDSDSRVIGLLVANNYLYDSSIIPTFAYPLLMRINNIFSGGIKRTHGPKWSWAFAPNKPYFPSLKKEWKRGKTSLLEVPCTTMPFLKVPIHMTFAIKLGYPYFRLSYELVKRTNSVLNYEFHAADLSDKISDSRLGHLNGVPIEKRIKLVRKILKDITRDYEIVTTENLVQRLL
ncbi:MAG: polysaccharide deacetylase family protein [archaeon]|nr:polysaccharide deacetylase family protein [archaeon]